MLALCPSYSSFFGDSPKFSSVSSLTGRPLNRSPLITLNLRQLSGEISSTPRQSWLSIRANSLSSSDSVPELVFCLPESVKIAHPISIVLFALSDDLHSFFGEIFSYTPWKYYEVLTHPLTDVEYADDTTSHNSYNETLSRILHVLQHLAAPLDSISNCPYCAPFFQSTPDATSLDTPLDPLSRSKYHGSYITPSSDVPGLPLLLSTLTHSSAIPSFSQRYSDCPSHSSGSESQVYSPA